MKHCNSEYKKIIESVLNNSGCCLEPNRIELLHPFTEQSFGIKEQLRKIYCLPMVENLSIALK